MAKVTRYGYSDRDDDDERRPARRGSRQSGSPIVPLAILLGMIVGAVILARSIAGRQDDGTVDAAPEEDTGPKPFADYHEEPPPPRERRSSGGTYKPAPSDLAATNPDWARALAIAAEADGLFDEATAANRADDKTLFLEKGKAAKEKYDEAFSMTAIWEEEILELYGDRDRQVREIVRARNDWINRVRFLHKSTGR